MNIKQLIKNNSGDTIVEVVVAIAILAFSMSGAYVLANRSLRTAVESNQRKEATAIAQSQIELLRNAYETDSNFVVKYETGTAFCLLTSQTIPYINIQPASPDSTGLCKQYHGLQYGVYVIYGAGYSAPSGAFGITVYWNSINGRGPAGPTAGTPNQSIINAYYRTPS